MIIKSTRISTNSGTKTIKNHLLNKPEDNEDIKVLYGDESDFETFHNFSKEDDTKFFLRHFSINPGQNWTTQQKQETVQKIREEYNAQDRPYFVVEHSKKLSDDTNNNHIHLLIPERFMGKTLDSKFTFMRNEKLSRMCEFDFSHEIVTGKHNKSVGFALQEDEKYKELSKIMLEVHSKKPMPKSEYNSQQHQIAKRQGINLPKEKNNIKDLYQQSDGWKSFHSALKHNNYVVKKGDKGTLIVEKDDKFIGALPRLLKMRKKDFNNYIKETKNENDRPNQKRHNRDSRVSSASRRTKQSRRVNRIDSSNESQNGPAEQNHRKPESENKRTQRIDEKHIQKSVSKMTFLDKSILNNLNNSDKIYLVKNEIKNNNNLLKNISKFFKSVFKKENDNISQKDLDDLNEIDLMSDDQKIMNSYISKELENEIFNPTKINIETQKTEPTKPEPKEPKPEPDGPKPDFSKWETQKIGRMSGKKPEKKDKKPQISMGSDTPTNLNNTLMEDKMRDKDLPAAPRPF